MKILQPFPTITPAPSVYRLQFDGNQNLLVIPTNPLFYSQVFTFECLLQTQSNANFAAIATTCLVGVAGWALELNGLKLLFHAKTDRSDALNGSTPLDLSEHHIAVTNDATHLTLWLDGALEAQAAAIIVTPQAAPFLFAGDPQGGSNFLAGKMRQIAYHKTARYTAPFSPPTMPINDANTVGLWKCSEGSGLVARDATGNGNDATLTGTPTPTWV